MALRLDTLPVEIIREIFLEVATIGQDFTATQPLLVLCRTCKRFKDIATPLLVRHWKWVGKDSASRLRLFIRHLHRHPEYEVEVRQICFWPINRTFIERTEKRLPSPEFSQDDGETLERLARESILGSNADLVKLVSNGDDKAVNDALLVLLLTRTPLLEHLDFKFCPRSYAAKLINKIAQLSESPNPGLTLPLQYLRSVFLRSPDSISVHVNDYGALFCLPRLNEITVCYPGTVLDPSRPTTLRPRVSNVKRIEIYSINGDFEGLCTVIESCKALKSLVICDGLYTKSYCMERFGRRLTLSQAHSLENLDIDEFTDGRFSQPCLREALIKLTTLHSLHIHIESIYTDDEIMGSAAALKSLYLLLPTSLKRLVLKQPRGEWRGWVYGRRVILILEQYVSDILAGREQTALEFIYAWQWLLRVDKVCAKLRRLCNEASISLKVCPPRSEWV